MPILNTNSLKADLPGVFISDLVLQILTYASKMERFLFEKSVLRNAYEELCYKMIGGRK